MSAAGGGVALAMATAIATIACTGQADAQARTADPRALQRVTLDPVTEARLLRLDPAHVSELDVREVLAAAPAPRVIGLQGSIPIVTMAPFAEFLIAMGYPAERLRNPRTGRFTYSSHGDSRELAGTLAWHFEREGMVPMLIGHSQGGMLVVKVLQDLAGASGNRLQVWDPVRGQAEDRIAVTDPLTGKERPVVGLRVRYAAALATGRRMRVILGQWGMIERLRSVPDTVEEFTGFFVAWDPIAGTGPEAATDDPYRPTGTAKVRNVMLPRAYRHITLPSVRHLAEHPAAREWINRYDPAAPPALPPSIPGVDVTNIIHAADIWASVKRHWCIEAQRLVRAKHALGHAER